MPGSLCDDFGHGACWARALRRLPGGLCTSVGPPMPLAWVIDTLSGASGQGVAMYLLTCLDPVLPRVILGGFDTTPTMREYLEWGTAAYKGSTVFLIATDC
ncbi:uncharacterized protein UV8b_08229 [Ustilaginoidea virens]|uniref:Uncharacterized protein n=1 Tax=Ustilaginoidea virens TaxID=1159556 RepID=A0A8E5MKS9_USTVR|nr:uncharacterized protein UV8b_08229 [Ustilaginoidea virens]QUC23988.1 hypothetical protein UV8b_08229 [Ustilaginoidea virens]